MAMISLNLGLLNLMPVPVLDGGHIAILALEGLSRRDFSMRVKEKMLLAGFVLLLTLMVTVIYNDLMRIAVDRTPRSLALSQRLFAPLPRGRRSASSLPALGRSGDIPIPPRAAALPHASSRVPPDDPARRPRSSSRSSGG